MSLAKFCLFMFTFLLISACSQADKNETIEVFALETFQDIQNDKGLYVKTGYKIVNAITTVEESKTHLKSDIKSVEDFYDGNGTYIQTEIIHTYANKSKLLLTEEGNTHSAQLQEPSTILTPSNPADNFKLSDMSSEEKKQVREHVLALMEKL
ncbi:hypothetical protein A8708_22370 [Paenibacillus oryzisoli]|uniref:Uncharacterized protein n=2 Tax=Paenibacillus oryzisoli TaxID=1850517 RepID=A0A198A283_9BACL|nr:hypothetical protein A8708_22370 [Paenibacillus oryzisoli]